MSLPNPVEQKSHDVINNKLSRVMKEVAEESMKMAAVEEYSSSPDNLLTVSGDGTWKTRGHSSLIGVCTVIGAETGKVLDREVLSSFCKGCDSYKGVKFGIKYNKNGKERIRFHVEKIILALLCKGNAESHLGCVWGHSCSTDDEPMHWFCPTNPNTWCKYNAAINNNLQNYKHKPSVAKAVRDVIKPVFADLSHPALLKKCLGDSCKEKAWHLFLCLHVTYRWTKMITFVRRLFPAYIDTTTTHAPTSGVRRTNDTVVMASVTVVTVASFCILRL
ncbi:uncharacterized protein TNCV_2681571 [Trichonephila clavipes]|nr:uncharacterized protein TNCV_2681571 [Trichonephila clavipes]